MDKRDNNFLLYANSIVSLNVGHSIWLSYEVEKKDKQLKNAIDITRRAYNDILRLDKQKRTNEALKCQILNNLGYYLACRGDKKDREFANQCAEFIVKRIHKFPHQSGGWQHTHDFIKSVYRD